MPDSLHPGPKGYEIWAQAVKELYQRSVVGARQRRIALHALHEHAHRDVIRDQQHHHRELGVQPAAAEPEAQPQPDAAEASANTAIMLVK